VSRARNTLVAKFLESRAEPLLFVDADIGFDPLQIVAMLNFGQEFVAGVAPVKDYFPDGLRYAATTCTTPERDASGRFITAERVGGSLMLLKRTVFEQMIAAYPGTRHTYDFVSRKGENLDCFRAVRPTDYRREVFPGGLRILLPLARAWRQDLARYRGQD
jgi:hypothetical protein